jgi:hypothetical protein
MYLHWQCLPQQRCVYFLNLFNQLVTSLHLQVETLPGVSQMLVKFGDVIHVVHVKPSSNATTLQNVLFLRTGVPLEQQVLVIAGRQLKVSRSIADIDVPRGAIVELYRAPTKLQFGRVPAASVSSLVRVCAFRSHVNDVMFMRNYLANV